VRKWALTFQFELCSLELFWDINVCSVCVAGKKLAGGWTPTGKQPNPLQPPDKKVRGGLRPRSLYTSKKPGSIRVTGHCRPGSVRVSGQCHWPSSFSAILTFDKINVCVSPGQTTANICKTAFSLHVVESASDGHSL